MQKKIWSVLLIPMIVVPFIIYTETTQKKEKVVAQPAVLVKSEQAPLVVIPDKPEKVASASKKSAKKKKNIGKSKKSPQPMIVKSEIPQEPIHKYQPATKKLDTPILVKSETTSTDITKSAKARAITFNNTITKKKLGYRYWGIAYYPSKFQLSINGKHIGNEESKAITINGDTCTLRYDFEFLGGRRKGWKEVIYKVDSNANSLDIDFDWKDKADWQIIIADATPLSQTSHHNSKEKK